MILSDIEIIKYVKETKMISPFIPTQTSKNVISYGLSSYGYDIRISDEFKIFTNINNSIIDPKHFDNKTFIDFKGQECIIPPNSFILGRSVEYLKIPREIMCIALGKSTLARCGLVANVTPLEPEWEGYITIEISNTTPLPAKIYANEGIVQVLFLKTNSSCKISYKDKKGKYQKQTKLTLPKI